MESIPKPEIPSPSSPLRQELPRASAPNHQSPKPAVLPEVRPGKKEGDSYRGTRSGRAYVRVGVAAEEQQLLERDDIPSTQGKNGRSRYWIVIVVAAGLALGATYWSWHQFGSNNSQNLLALTAADVNQQFTQSARTSLLQGQVPTYLSSASTEILNQIKDGEMDLVSKNLADSPQSAGAMVHVYISINGQAATNEVLTPEQPKTTIFPVSRNSVTRLHYVVDSAGSAGAITLSVPSTAGAVLSTGLLKTGAQADLQLIER